jgi:hypothetical protein
MALDGLSSITWSLQMIADHGVAVGPLHCARGLGRWIAAGTRVGEILPDRTVLGIDFVIVGLNGERKLRGFRSRDGVTGVKVSPDSTDLARAADVGVLGD